MTVILCKGPAELGETPSIIHILTGHEVSSVRLFPRGTLSDQNRGLFPEAEGRGNNAFVVW